MAKRTQFKISADPAVEREVRAAAAEAGASISDVANHLLAGALGVEARESVGGKGARRGSGRFARSEIGRLADRGGWFTAADAMAAAGTSYVVTCVHLGELVKAGVLVERELYGARGTGRPRKEWVSAEPYRND
jgi:hypothetical protein